MGLDVASSFERVKQRWIFFIQLVLWRLLKKRKRKNKTNKKHQTGHFVLLGIFLDLEKESYDIMFTQKRCKNSDRKRRISWIIPRNELVSSPLVQVCWFLSVCSASTAGIFSYLSDVFSSSAHWSKQHIVTWSSTKCRIPFATTLKH